MNWIRNRSTAFSVNRDRQSERNMKWIRQHVNGSGRRQGHSDNWKFVQFDFRCATNSHSVECFDWVRVNRLRVKTQWSVISDTYSLQRMVHWHGMTEEAQFTQSVPFVAHEFSLEITLSSTSKQSTNSKTAFYEIGVVSQILPNTFKGHSVKMYERRHMSLANVINHKKRIPCVGQQNPKFESQQCVPPSELSLCVRCACVFDQNRAQTLNILNYTYFRVDNCFVHFNVSTKPTYTRTQSFQHTIKRTSSTRRQQHKRRMIFRNKKKREKTKFVIYLRFWIISNRLTLDVPRRTYTHNNNCSCHKAEWTRARERRNKILINNCCCRKSLGCLSLSHTHFLRIKINSKKTILFSSLYISIGSTWALVWWCWWWWIRMLQQIIYYY